ncbi:interphotoreceptor matrix proteoglycan 2-like isoform X3 [Oxyura jamaicensis]|uniref:interphotoreceptor matrix proteoglycan 2-like isoform X3 n=1 Tax=Oxyura jamaicensis TaxID=8884 RepID=UPI0015A6C09E|nr:interphotoreceptor matrix proteoglycan 2-like isoform X3 [Oxyura jamaicensis]
MGFVPALQDPASRERRGLLHSFNRTVAPLFMSVPGFLRLEVTGIREGSVVLEYDALFAAERVRAPGLGALLDAALGSGGTRPGLAVGAAPILRNVALERPLDPCAELFACRAGFACVAGADGNATCTSLCHRDYCKNHGICTHPRDRGPLCQCPVGSDFWFMGLRCDYRVTQQSLLGMAVGVLLSIVLLGAVIAGIVIRRFKALLLEARADQTRSSYRRFCRLDDVSAQYWSRSWLASASSLDNPAFTNSEELLHLQVLDNGCCGCREAPAGASSHKQRPAPPARPAHRPSFHYNWDTSSSSVNDPMVDSGKASDISVSSWPMEPIPWTPFPVLHHLSRQRPHKARRPHSYCEGMELVNLERSWTA